jgi:hypothetical protein
MSGVDLTPLIEPQWFTDLTVEVLMQDTISHHQMEANYNIIPATTYLVWKVSISLCDFKILSVCTIFNKILTL